MMDYRSVQTTLEIRVTEQQGVQKGKKRNNRARSLQSMSPSPRTSFLPTAMKVRQSFLSKYLKCEPDLEGGVGFT